MLYNIANFIYTINNNSIQAKRIIVVLQNGWVTSAELSCREGTVVRDSDDELLTSDFQTLSGLRLVL